MSRIRIGIRQFHILITGNVLLYVYTECYHSSVLRSGLEFSTDQTFFGPKHPLFHRNSQKLILKKLSLSDRCTANGHKKLQHQFSLSNLSIGRVLNVPIRIFICKVVWVIFLKIITMQDGRVITSQFCQCETKPTRSKKNGKIKREKKMTSQF